MDHLERRWRIDISGREVVENREIVTKAGRTFKVYGTATMDFVFAARVKIRKVRKHWVYGDGEISTCQITGHRMRYNPDHVFNVKRVFLSNAGSVARFQGRRIGGSLPDDDTLKLTWPRPNSFREPAVEVVILDGGKEKQACFVFDHFLDIISAYDIKLKDGWQQHFENKYSGALERARVAYDFTVKKDQ